MTAGDTLADGRPAQPRGMTTDGKIDKAGRPKNPLLLAPFVLGFRHVFYVTRPPLWVQPLTVTPLAAFARLLGYKRYDEKYRVHR